ncbi:phosphate-starvation-inducible protein PsiE [Thioalkalivibrio sulfidiphilus]|uniref:phosphate-starvation-inducible protein PsiE n=1 Tax=Thioalkalivibrio sulfidiphilus TaxID=1033854 RepID=UPI001E2D0AF2|nr:phosphate-starvation-inducible PsiE family protein [Thioalkalivibrio sulfidiphilus]
MNPRRAGLSSLKLLENLALVIITVATTIAIFQEVMVMIEQREVRLADLLLLFIYLEVLAMVGIYIKSGQLPVRMPIYIAIVALARYLILDMKEMDFWQIMGVTLGVLLLAAAVLVIRYGHVRFPYESYSGDQPAASPSKSTKPPGS